MRVTFTCSSVTTTRTNKIYTRRVWYSHAECDLKLHECNFHIHESDFSMPGCHYNTHEGDFYTQSAIFTWIVWFTRREWFPHQKTNNNDTHECDLKFEQRKCDFHTRSVISTITSVIFTCMRGIFTCSSVTMTRTSVISTRRVWFQLTRV
jgi:hypothetical protein